MDTELDFQASNHGTIYLLQPLSERAAAHLTPERVQDDAQWLGTALAVEHRYMIPLALDLQRAGFSVRID